MGPRGPKLLVISPTVLLRHSHPHPTPRVQAGTGWTETGQGSTAVPSSVAPREAGTARGSRPPREAQLRSPRHRPPPPRFCGKKAAGAGVAAGASCPCDRAERGTRGHVGKTLVPAALPARNAPPAPQSPPAWPRNGDSHAPCSHPLGAHPARPTKTPCLGCCGPTTCLAQLSLCQRRGLGNLEPQSSSGVSWDVHASPSTQACLFWTCSE